MISPSQYSPMSPGAPGLGAPSVSMVWYGMVWYGMVWYGMLWYAMVWYGRVPRGCFQYHDNSAPGCSLATLQLPPPAAAPHLMQKCLIPSLEFQRITGGAPLSCSNWRE